MNKLKLILLSTFATIVFACNSSNSNTGEKAEAISGEQLFKINCTQCHKPAGDLVGPALKGAAARWKDKTLLYEFVRAPQEVIAKEDYAKTLFITYKQVYMLPFPNLTNQQIDAILSYCETAQ